MHTSTRASSPKKMSDCPQGISADSLCQLRLQIRKYFAWYTVLIMAVLPITTLADLPTIPLIPYTSTTIAEVTIHPFGICDIVVGLTKETVDKLFFHSADTTDTALGFTQDAQRFANHESYVSWFKKGRIPFALLHRDTSSLMAVAWIGEASIPELEAENQHTVAYRSYLPYRGGGFMTSFMTYVLETYKKRNPDCLFWVRIDPQNTPSLSFAQKLGFTTRVISAPHTDRIVLTT